jgi:hypothetical protein
MLDIHVALNIPAVVEHGLIEIMMNGVSYDSAAEEVYLQLTRC